MGLAMTTITHLGPEPKTTLALAAQRLGLKPGVNDKGNGILFIATGFSSHELGLEDIRRLTNRT